MHAPQALHFEDTHAGDAVLAFGTFVLGAVGLLLVGAGEDRAGMVLGAIGVFTGLWGQLISRTRAERFADVIGLVAAGLAFALGAAFGSITITS